MMPIWPGGFLSAYDFPIGVVVVADDVRHQVSNVTFGRGTLTDGLCGYVCVASADGLGEVNEVEFGELILNSTNLRAAALAPNQILPPNIAGRDNCPGIYFSGVNGVTVGKVRLKHSNAEGLAFDQSVVTKGAIVLSLLAMDDMNEPLNGSPHDSAVRISANGGASYSITGAVIKNSEEEGGQIHHSFDLANYADVVCVGNNCATTTGTKIINISASATVADNS